MSASRLAAPTNLRPRGRRFLLCMAALFFAGLGSSSLAEGMMIKSKAVVAQVLLDRAWGKTLSGEAAVKPWGWADVWPVLKIEAPRLHKSAIVLSGVSGEAMAFGPGLMSGPAPGDSGLAIIAAHRETHFRFLRDIRIGDEVAVTDASGVMRIFAITETRVVKANHSGLEVEGGPARIALVTCWPFDARKRGDDRFVAIGALRAAKLSS